MRIAWFVPLALIGLAACSVNTAPPAAAPAPAATIVTPAPAPTVVTPVPGAIVTTP